MNQATPITPTHRNLMTRTNIIISGLIGLIGAIIVTIFCIFVVFQSWLPPLLSNGFYLWSLFFFLALFSVAEIPLMLFGMRRIAVGDNPKAAYIVLFTNAAYTLFAAVYAAPFILLTGGILAGSALASLSLARFVSSIFFLPYDQ